MQLLDVSPLAGMGAGEGGRRGEECLKPGGAPRGGCLHSSLLASGDRQEE